MTHEILTMRGKRNTKLWLRMKMEVEVVWAVILKQSPLVGLSEVFHQEINMFAFSTMWMRLHIDVAK